MSIKDDIAELEAQLVVLRQQEEQGFSTSHDSYCTYTINDEHVLVYDLDENYAGIIINVKAMQKYMESLK